jgi:hypothetical protein
MSRTTPGAESHAALLLHPDFQRAFVAMRYFLGAREADLAGALPSVTADARAVVERLEHADRARRAEALAVEVGHVVRSLGSRNFR